MLNQNKIQLSICIPTYNRKHCLRKTLDSICLQDVFRDTCHVEVVISDNNSTDGTKELCDEYVAKYGRKVKYYHNSESIPPDENHIMSLKKGSGLLLKLTNDTLYHRPGSLIKILKLIEGSIQSRKTLFFLNGKKYSKKVSYCGGVEDLILTCSFWTTWIGGFSVWKDQFWELDDFSRYSSLKLGHVDALLRMVSVNGAIVYNEMLFDVLSIEHKGDYNLFEVFLKNYPYILSEYIDRGMLSHSVLKIEKRKVLFELICPWVAKSIYGNKTNFNTEDHLRHVKRYFSDKKVIFYYLFRLKLFGVAIVTIKFIRRLLK